MYPLRTDKPVRLQRLTGIGLLIVALWLYYPVCGQKATTHPKNTNPTITLTNPVSGIKLTFHNPAFVETPVNNSAWKELTIHTKDDTFTIKAPDQTGYMINNASNFRQFWSPDGQYISLYRVYGIVSKEKFSGMALMFMALSYGEAVDFTTRTGTSITTDNFAGWAKGKPHTALAGKYGEADPEF